ncbi:MAG: hypothetical protein LBL96_04615 [Clostridiales bacterium]|jgi:hypothetical protein|nr:hypothetical protein [Clostridiales bacterium]
MKTSKQLDERQVLIRGKVLWHGLIAATVLLLGNAFLQSIGVVWASGFAQNITILLAIVTVVSVEMIFRDVYFGNTGSNIAITVIFDLMAISSAILTIRHIASGTLFFKNGAFTPEGESLPQFILLLIIAVSMTAKELLKRRENEACDE